MGNGLRMIDEVRERTKQAKEARKDSNEAIVKELWQEGRQAFIEAIYEAASKGLTQIKYIFHTVRLPYYYSDIEARRGLGVYLFESISGDRDFQGFNYAVDSKVDSDLNTEFIVGIHWE